MTVVYVDSVFILNGVMDYLLLLVTARLAGIPLRRRRYLLAALAGAAYAVAVFLPELKENLIFLFIGGMIVTSFVEYITGRLMEKILHKKWWDYSDQKFHLDGYICLRVSALWGVCSVLMIYFLNPFFCGLVNMIPRLIGEVILWVLLGLLIADGLGSGIAVLELKRKKGRIEQITDRKSVV